MSMSKWATKKGMKNVVEVTRWAKENGYDGIRYSPDFDEALGLLSQARLVNRGYTAVLDTRSLLFDPKVADQVIAPKSKVPDAGEMARLKENAEELSSP